MLLSWGWLVRRWHALAVQVHFVMGVGLGLSVMLTLFSPNSLLISHVDPRTERDLGKTAFNSYDVPTNSRDDLECRESSVREVRLLIWVMTSPKSLDKQANIIKNTWGRRVKKLLFMSSSPNKTFPAIGLNVDKDPDDVGGMTNQGFRYIYEHHLDDADWFMKVDDDTFVIVENLMYFLSDEDAQEPVFFGHQLRLAGPDNELRYNCRKGGYVLSKEALRRFGEKGQASSSCRQSGEENEEGEERDFARCMHSLGIGTADTTDTQNRTRFHCFDPETHLLGRYPDWYSRQDPHGARKGLHSLSDYPITFHTSRPEKIRWLQYYVYQLQPYGSGCSVQQLNKPPRNSGAFTNFSSLA